MLLARFRASVWRFWLLKLRQPFLTILEFSFPVLVMTLFGILYHTNLLNLKGPQIIPTKQPLDATDILPRVQNMDEQLRIIYCPNNSFTRQLMESLPLSVPRVPIIACQDESCLYTHLEDFFDADEDNQSLTTVGVQFDTSENLVKAPRRLTYTLLVEGLKFDNESFLSLDHIDNSDNPYKSSGFIQVQSLVTLGYLKMLANDTMTEELPNFHFKATKFPIVRHTTRERIIIMKEVLPRLVGYTFMSICPMLLRMICNDKKYRAKETMHLVGMSDFTYYLGIFLNYLFVSAVPMLIATIVIFFKLTGDMSPVEHSSPIVVYVTLLLYMAHFIVFVMACSAFFSNYKLAIVCTLLVHVVLVEAALFVLTKPGFARTYTFDWKRIEIPELVHLLLCVIPNFALDWTFTLIAESERYPGGSQLNNFFKPLPTFTLMSLGWIMGIMLIASLLGCIWLWYMERIFPAQKDTAKPFYFPMQPTHWQICVRGSSSEQVVDSSSSANLACFEREDTLKTVLVVSRLYKTFYGVFFRKIIIDDLNLYVYEREITVLLGNSGAGKTTVVRIITGIIGISKGTVLVDGYDVNYETQQARRLVGVMTPSEFFHDALTVTEHLYFYGRLKKLHSIELKKQIVQILVKLGLGNKARARSDQLPLSIKRKLSLAVAMLGQPKLLILDEPTIGLNAQARQWFWDTLTKMKEEVAMLVTTSSIEEARVLGDRITILSDGRNQCFGSQKFLRSHFGVGYHIQLSKTETFNSSKFRALVETHFVDIKTNENNAECWLTVDHEYASKLHTFFAKMDAQKKVFGIHSYKVTVTTLNDVFKQNKICEVSTDEIKMHLSYKLTPSIDRVKGFFLFWQQLQALLAKRLIYSKRVVLNVLAKLFIPSFGIFLLVELQSLHIQWFSVETKCVTLNMSDLTGNKKTFVHEFNLNKVEYDTKQFQEIVNLYQNALDIDPEDMTETNCNFLKPDEYDVASCWYNYVLGAIFNISQGLINRPLVTALHNPSEIDAMPITVQLIYQAVYKLILRHHDNVADSGLNTVKCNYRPTEFYENYVKKVDYGSFFYLLLMPFAMVFLSTRNVIFPIHQNVSKVKLALLIAGIRPTLLWFAHFMYDLVLLIGTNVLTVLVLGAFNKVDFLVQAGDGIQAFLFFSTLYGFAVMPIHYAVSSYFQSIKTGYLVTAIASLILTVTFGALLFILDSDLCKTWTPSWICDSLMYALRFFPWTCLTWTYRKIFGKGALVKVCESIPKGQLTRWCKSDDESLNEHKRLSNCCRNRQKESIFNWSREGLNEDLLLLVLQSIFYWIILIAVEARVWQTLKKVPLRKSIVERVEMNDDLVQETKRVEQLCKDGKPSERVVIVNLTKRFKKETVIDDVSLAIREGEIFAIFGQSGTGKTTLLAMLATDIPPSEGDIFMESDSLTKNRTKYRRHISYCPQHDSLLERLTGREMLYFTAQARGIDDIEIGKHVNILLDMLDLMDIADKQTITYSRSSRRRLCVALAFVAFPKVVLLDEPMTGIEGKSKSKIRATISNVQKATNCTVIMTCGRIDDCEFAFTRMTIMVNGRFHCLGSREEVLTKFGQGFTLFMKVSYDELEEDDELKGIDGYICKIFPSARLRFRQKAQIYYNIEDSSIEWSVLFDKMEKTKNKLALEEYWISDVTLEHIFLYFYRELKHSMSK